MHVLSMERSTRSFIGQFRPLATFSVAINDGLRMYDLTLAEAESGRRVVFAPCSKKAKTATFSSTFAAELAQLASTHFDNGNRALDRNRNR